MIKRDKVLQIRLSEEEKAALERIAEKLKLQDSATLLKVGVMKIINEIELKEYNDLEETISFFIENKNK